MGTAGPVGMRSLYGSARFDAPFCPFCHRRSGDCRWLRPFPISFPYFHLCTLLGRAASDARERIPTIPRQRFTSETLEREGI